VNKGAPIAEFEKVASEFPVFWVVSNVPADRGIDYETVVKADDT
jgi:hypothetical protein